MSTKEIEKLKEIGTLIRRDIIEMLAEAGSGHPGGSLSAADLVACLYFSKMNFSKENYQDPQRDYFILSKGHAAPVLYAALTEVGLIERSDHKNLRKYGKGLQGHPDRSYTKGVEVSTGSLGQGLSVAVGVALANRLNGFKNKVYCLIGDGESQEGQIWEAAMMAAHQKLDNIVAILDRNNLQIDGNTEDVKALGDIAGKWSAFGWEVIEIDGHDYEQILNALDKADTIKSKPVMILANTVKGKGVSFMENKVNFHGVAPNEEERSSALKELEK